MTKWLLRIFSLIGGTAVGYYIFDVVRLQNDANTYLSNCKQVQIGMSLAEAKRIMGDYDYYSRTNRSEIWTLLNDDTVKVYFLSYPAPFAASEQTSIFFDPATQLVTGVACGEATLAVAE